MRKRPIPLSPFPDNRHDHAACREQALLQAETYCRRHGLRLTSLRRRVLELVWSSHQPVGAYTLLEQLVTEGRKAAPPTVYRSLDFLLNHGLIHRIASLNAYVGCNHPGSDHEAQFFICVGCGQAAEIGDPSIESAIAQDAKALGFSIASQTIEVAGTCARCREAKRT
ncbi:MAG: Fur family transcriptional regulator [Candidatus Thiodiazotropha sp.]|jgi:Fur family transcriptional regulator, zinc uptake regulator